jgi:hypothetical protein
VRWHGFGFRGPLNLPLLLQWDRREGEAFYICLIRCRRSSATPLKQLAGELRDRLFRYDSAGRVVTAHDARHLGAGRVKTGIGTSLASSTRELASALSPAKVPKLPGRTFTA